MSSRDNERLLVVFETDSNSTTVTIGGIYNHFRLIQVKFIAIEDVHQLLFNQPMLVKALIWAKKCLGIALT